MMTAATVGFLDGDTGKMLLGFKTQLKLNNKQKSLLAKHAGVARHAYNWGLSFTKQLLDYNQANPEEKVKFPTAIDLHKLLVAVVKPENPWYYEVSKCAPQYALRHLRDGWSRCFQGIAKPPKFKKKGRNDSFTLDGSITVNHFSIKVPVIGKLRTYERLPQGVKVKSVTISKRADRWFISFKCEQKVEAEIPENEPVGVDLGINSLATLSTGKKVENPKAYKKAEKRLKRLQKAVSAKEKGSRNRQKAVFKLAELHGRVANIRKDTLNKLTTFLAKNHSVVVIEDLNVSGMLSNHKLAKAIADVGFYEFRRQLEYKCQIFGSKLIIVDQWFPSSKTCSGCGAVKESLSLDERVFKCSECGLELDRDLNAALNLKKKAVV